jgi:penicillin-binding protein-related factor A (putative recombinase)
MTATTTHANRGKQLEAAIREVFKHYAARGIHCHQNFPRQLHDGTIVEKGPFDFEVLYNGTLYAFDAKQCEATSWHPDKRHLHQEKMLLEVTRQGGQGFYLVYFVPLRKLVRFDVPLPTSKGLRPEDGLVLPGLDFLGILGKRS